MSYRQLAVILLLLFILVPSSFADEEGHRGGDGRGVNYAFYYYGRTYQPSTDYTTFTYKLCWNGQGPELSHFVLGVPDCSPDLEVVTTGLNPLGECSQPSQPSFDPATQTYGIKWSNCSDFDQGCDFFTLKVDGNKAEGPASWVAKAGDCNRTNTCAEGTTTGPTCDSGGDLPPVCLVEGPYNVACGSPGVVTVSAENSYDPSCENSSLGGNTCALTYEWFSNCPDRVITGGNTVSPTITFNTLHGQSVAQACYVFLKIRDSANQEATCQNTINISECEFDCLGLPAGTARLDDCGVCNGNNSAKDSCGVCFGENQNLDTCGVCFGNNQDKDECGICFGDGSSCAPTCQETNIFGSLFTLDNLSGNYLALIKKLGRNLKKATNNKLAGRAQLNKAQNVFNDNWELVWSLPQVIKSNCAPATLCVNVNYTSELDQYKNNHDQFGAIAEVLLSKLSKVGVDTTALRERKLKLDRADRKLLARIPKDNQICD